MKQNKKLYIIFIILLMIFSISIVEKHMQNDTFFTIPIAEDMLDRGGLDGIDHLSQHENLKFTHSGWIFDLIIYYTYIALGFTGIYLLIIFITILISILLFNLCLKKNNNIIISFVIVSFMLLAASGVFAARGQIFSFLIFLLELYAIDGLINTGKRRYICALFVLPIILANTHDTVWPFYFIMFLPYIAEFIISKINFFKNEEPFKIIIEENKYIRIMLIIIFISLLTGLLTPVFGTAYINLFTVMQGVSKDFIQELQVTSIFSKIPLLLVIFSVLGILSFTKTKVKLIDLLYVFGFVLLSLMVERNVYFLYLLGTPFVINIITTFIETYKKEELPKLTEKFSKSTFCIIIFSLIFIIFSIEGITVNLNKDYVDKNTYPVDAVEWMKKNINIENMTIYNSFDYGSYLELNGIKVFIDSRSGIYCEEFTDGSTIMYDYLNVEKGAVNYKDIFEQYKITHVLIKNDSLINQYICYDNEYECIYQDDIFVLYEKITDI